MFERIVSRGTLVTVIVLILTVVGLVAVTNISVQMIPDLDVRTITVRTAWPGATPQDVEKEILIEQEEYLRNVPSLKRLVARASFGNASIQLEFPYGVDINETLIRVSNALSQVPSYPNNADEPRIFATSFSGNSFMFFRVAPLAGNPRNLDMVLMQDFLKDNVQTRMESIPGVSQVSVYGGADRQIQILLDPARLAEHGLTVNDVRQAIRERNRDASGGEIESGKRRYLLRTIGRFADLEDLRELIIERRGDALIRLGDLAEVRLSHFALSGYSYSNGQSVLGLSVRREAGSNVIEIKRDMLRLLDEINQDVLQPAGMVMRLVADDVGYVQDSLRNVWQNLLIGAVLASAVMFLFLRSGRATLVAIMGIPICTIAAFLGLLLAGRSINVVSLAGVAFAIGMTLDNSIVVLDSIEQARRRGLDRFRSAVEGVRQVWPAVLASTLTTVLVFVPIVFIKQEAGQLYSDIAIAVSASILASMLVAITVLPTAAARLSFRTEEALGTESGLRRRVLDGITWLTSGRLRRIATVTVSAGACLAAFVWLTPPAEYLPEGEEPKTFARMSAPPGYNLGAMSRVGADIQAYFLPFLDHTPDQFERGETAVPAMKYLNLRIRPDSLRIIAEPKDPAHIRPLMDALRDKYAEYPGMRSFVSRGSIITSNDGGTRSVDLDIAGPDLATLYDVARAADRRAREIFDRPRVKATPSSLSFSQPMIELHPDWARARELGMTAADVGFALSALTDGAFVDEFLLDDDKIDIYLFGDSGTRASLDTLGQLPIYTPSGTVVPLSTVARVVERVDTNNIRRVDGRRMVTLSIIPPEDVALETAVERVRSELVRDLRAQGVIPNSVSIDISGAVDQLDATRAALSTNYLVAVIIIYLLLVAIFTHWGYPWLIMLTIPLGVAGGIVGLWLMNWAGGSVLPLLGQPEVTLPFDMIAMLGFLILMGTVVNNPILIVHQAMANLRDAGMSAREAVRHAVATRLRPIAMSTMTTVAGLAPLVFLPGAGAELYRGVGAIVLFGVLGTAVISLTFLPAVSIAVLGRRQRQGGDEGRSRSATGDAADLTRQALPASRGSAE
jgi:multidrug efflux pump subunit AcrB